MSNSLGEQFWGPTPRLGHRCQKVGAFKPLSSGSSETRNSKRVKLHNTSVLIFRFHMMVSLVSHCSRFTESKADKASCTENCLCLFFCSICGKVGMWIFMYFMQTAKGPFWVCSMARCSGSSGPSCWPGTWHRQLVGSLVRSSSWFQRLSLFFHGNHTQLGKM